MAASASAIRAGKAYVELGTDDSGFTKGLKAASGKLKAFGSGLSSVGKKFLAIGARIGGPLLAAAKVFANVGSEMAELSEKTGVSVESLSGLKYAAEQGGVGIDSLAGGFRKMQKFMADAQNGSKENQEELAALGVSMADLKNLSPDQQFEKFADAISNIHDPAQKAAAAMQVFGKGGVDLLPLLEQGSAGIDGFVKHAKDLGLIISGEDAKSAKQFQQSLGDLWAVISQGVFVIGGALAPVLKGIVQSISKVIVSASAWLKEHKTLIVGVLAAAAALAGFGAAVLSIGTLISTVGSVFATLGTIFSIAMAPLGIIVALLGALMSPIGLVIAAVAGLGVAWGKLTSSGRAAMATLGDSIGRLFGDAMTAFGGIKDALSAGDFALAARILWLTLKLEFQRGLATLAAVWADLKAGALTGINNAMYLIGRISIGGWTEVKRIWGSAITTLLDMLSVLANKTGAVLRRSAAGWKIAWVELQEAIGAIKEGTAHAQIKQINRDVKGEDASAEKGLVKEIGDRDAAADKNDAQLKGSLSGAQQKALDDLKSQHDSDNAAVAASAAETVAALQGDISAANLALRSAAYDAAAAAAEKAKQDGLKKDAKDAMDGLDGVQKKFSVSGTFSSARLGALAGGANSAAERTAKASEKTNALLTGISRQLGLGTALGAVFGT